MTAEEFIDQLDAFCRSTIGDKWQFNYEQEDDGLLFKSFVAWGFEESCYNDDRCECPRCIIGNCASCDYQTPDKHCLEHHDLAQGTIYANCPEGCNE